MRNWGGGVTTQTVAGTKTVCDNPNCVWLHPQLRKAAGTITAGRDDFVYLDLQDMADFKKLREPQLFFDANKGTVICLDEIQLAPQLFSVLRSEIDRNRQPGRFILLGSASQELIQKTSETPAGRIGIMELTPFSIDELMRHHSYTDIQVYWNRGGYPNSFLAIDDAASTMLGARDELAVGKKKETKKLEASDLTYYKTNFYFNDQK